MITFVVVMLGAHESLGMRVRELRVVAEHFVVRVIVGRHLAFTHLLVQLGQP